MYNPSLQGFSTGGKGCHKNGTNDLNVAQHNATGKNMLGQAKELVERARELGQRSFTRDWKLITIYVGTIDVCTLSCLYSEEEGAEHWINNITEALDFLKHNLPRALVNLVQLMNIGDVMTSTISDSKLGNVCNSLYMTVCDCAHRMNENETDLETFIELIENYQTMLHFTISHWNDPMLNNFTVILQPFMKTVTLDLNTDVDQFPLASDCLHLSPSGYRSMAVALWNNMFERVGRKTSNFHMSETQLKCPTEADPYIYTERNSIVQVPGNLNRIIST